MLALSAVLASVPACSSPPEATGAKTLRPSPVAPPAPTTSAARRRVPQPTAAEPKAVDPKSGGSLEAASASPSREPTDATDRPRRVARPASSGDSITVARKGKSAPLARSPVEEPPPEPSAAKSMAATESRLPADPDTAPTPGKQPPASVGSEEPPGASDGSEGAEPVEAGPVEGQAVASRPVTEPSEHESAPAPLTETEARTLVREYIERLRSDAETADQAFRELWEVRKDLIPALILEAENPQPSALKKLSILVLDRQRFVRIDEAQDKIVYSIPGMGNFRYDDVAAGPTRSGLGAKAVFRSFQKPFAVGVVLRAALVNRFRSADYPSGDAAADPIGWWQRFHEKVASKL